MTGSMIRHSATRATRRKPTFGEVFTAFYTSIMGTAAVLDAKAKDTRRKELVRQLEEARADLKMVMEAAERDTELTNRGPPGNIHNRYKGAWRDHPRHTGIAEFLDALGDPVIWVKTPSHPTALDELWRCTGAPRSGSITGPGYSTDYEALHARLEKEESDFAIAHRSPRNLRQLSVQEERTRSLVIQLLKAAGYSSEEVYKNCLADYYDLQPTAKGVRKKRVWQYPLYEGARGDSDDLTGRNLKLNRNLRAIMDHSRAAMRENATWDPKENIVKMCHNILVSPHPPTIHTLTTLILGFDRLGQHELANAAVRHFLYFTRLEPTQQSLVSLLNHYKEQGNLTRFYGIIQRCTGYDPRGINIRQKTVQEMNQVRHLQEWRRLTDTGTRDGIINARPWFGPHVIDAIVQGLAAMDCLRAAVAVAIFCSYRGLSMGSQTVLKLVDQCAETAGNETALQLVQFMANASRHFSVIADKSPRDFLEALRTWFDAIGLSSSEQKFSVSEVEEAMRAPNHGQGREQVPRTTTLQHRVIESQRKLEEIRVAVETVSETPSNPTSDKSKKRNKMPVSSIPESQNRRAQDTAVLSHRSRPMTGTMSAIPQTPMPPLSLEHARVGFA